MKHRAKGAALAPARTCLAAVLLSMLLFFFVVVGALTTSFNFAAAASRSASLNANAAPVLDVPHVDNFSTLPSVGATVATSPAIAAGKPDALFNGLSEMRNEARYASRTRLESLAKKAGTGAADDVVRPVDDVIGGLPKGRQTHVWVVRSDAELQAVYDDLVGEAQAVSGRGSYNGSWVVRSDGVEVGLRSASRTGGRTVDIVRPDGTRTVVHIPRGATTDRTRRRARPPKWGQIRRAFSP